MKTFNNFNDRKAKHVPSAFEALFFIADYELSTLAGERLEEISFFCPRLK